MFDKNDGFDTMCKIADVLWGKEYFLDKRDLEIGDTCYRTYASLSSVYVEGSFLKH